MDLDLENSTTEKIDRLAENWGVEREVLVEKFSETYEDFKGIGSEEEKQDIALDRLAMKVAADPDRFRAAVKARKKPPDEPVHLRLHRKDCTELDPLSYSTGKDQVEVIEDIVEAFESSDLVFLKGVVGSGKSVIGIRTALEFGGGIVSVPTKVLSHQYRDDYEKGKYFVNDDEGKVEISVLKGRGNFTCPYLAEEHPEWEYTSCQSRSLPCTRPLGKEESRIGAIEECPYWGFIFPTSSALKKRDEHVDSYRSLVGRHSLFLKGEGRCPYWNQFGAYLDADVIVLNSRKWEIEARIGRLPLSDITVIDEADAWLDGLSSKVSITEERIGRLVSDLADEGLAEEAGEVRRFWTDYKEGFESPMELAESLMEVLKGVEYGSRMYWQVSRVLDMREEIVTEEEEGKVTYYIPDPKPVLSRIKNQVDGKWLMMSATVQDREVLNRIYGIDPVFVKGEVKFPGKLVQRTLGSEKKVNNRRWEKPSFRRRYGEIRNRILKEAQKPGFAPVHATKYLPSHLKGLTEDNWREENGLRFSTKMNRGADLKEMESVVLLKYPYPDLGDPLLKATRKRLGEKKFWMYYHDMAEREFIQQVGRVVRSPEDVVEFWSPDQECHKKLRQAWNGKVERG